MPWEKTAQCSAVTSYALKKLADIGLSKIAEALRKAKVTLHTTKDDVEAALNHHLREVKNWSSEISFSDLRNPKVTADVFVPLNVFLHPRRWHVASTEAGDAVSLEGLLDDTLKPAPATLQPSPTPLPPKHLIILGQPGAGKTTSMKHLCHRLLHEEGFLGDKINLPLLVRLRDVNLHHSPFAFPAVLLTKAIRTLEQPDRQGRLPSAPRRVIYRYNRTV